MICLLVAVLSACAIESESGSDCLLSMHLSLLEYFRVRLSLCMRSCDCHFYMSAHTCLCSCVRACEKLKVCTFMFLCLCVYRFH